MKKSRLLALGLALALTLSIAGCTKTPTPLPAPPQTLPDRERLPSPTPTPTPTPSATPDDTADRPAVNLAVLKGNTGMSAVKLLADNEAGTTVNDYAVTLAADPTEVNSKLINGDIDIAALPTQRGRHPVQQDRGRRADNRAVRPGRASICWKTAIPSTPSPTWRARPSIPRQRPRRQSRVCPQLSAGAKRPHPGADVTVEWKDSDELSALLASGDVDLAMMPVPAATAVTIKNPDVRFALTSQRSGRPSTPTASSP